MGLHEKDYGNMKDTYLQLPGLCNSMVGDFIYQYWEIMGEDPF